jgi:hypothetical protein
VVPAKRYVGIACPDREEPGTTYISSFAAGEAICPRQCLDLLLLLLLSLLSLLLLLALGFFFFIGFSYCRDSACNWLKENYTAPPHCIAAPHCMQAGSKTSPGFHIPQVPFGGGCRASRGCLTGSPILHHAHDLRESGQLRFIRLGQTDWIPPSPLLISLTSSSKCGTRTYPGISSWLASSLPNKASSPRGQRDTSSIHPVTTVRG